MPLPAGQETDVFARVLARRLAERGLALEVVGAFLMRREGPTLLKINLVSVALLIFHILNPRYRDVRIGSM